MNVETMTWPEHPTCHGPTNQYTRQPIAYRVRDNLTALDHPYRTCEWCGSIHPEDLLAVLVAGARLHGSDWKYGYPHKFYVDIPNPRAGEDTKIGSKSWIDQETGARREEEMRGAAPSEIMGKFYTDHLTDQGYSAAALIALLDALTRHTGITWARDEAGKIVYYAPYPGYQRS